MDKCGGTLDEKRCKSCAKCYCPNCDFTCSCGFEISENFEHVGWRVRGVDHENRVVKTDGKWRCFLFSDIDKTYIQGWKKSELHEVQKLFAN